MRKRAALVKPPDQDPIQIGHFCLTSTGMTVTGRPTFAEYERVGDFIKRAHQASGFWLADWLRFGESRQDWQERLSQAHHATGQAQFLKSVIDEGAATLLDRVASRMKLTAGLAPGADGNGGGGE